MNDSTALVMLLGSGGWLVWLIFYLFACAMAGTAASKNGQSSASAFFISLFFTPLFGMLWVIAIGQDKNELSQRLVRASRIKKCHACCEYIDIDALRCPHCNEEYTNGRKGSATATDIWRNAEDAAGRRG